MPDLLHYDSGSGHTTETESSDVPAVILGAFPAVPSSTGTAWLWHAALRLLAQLPYEARWAESVNRGGITYASAGNTRVRLATFRIDGLDRTLTPNDTTFSYVAPAPGRRVDAPPVDPTDIGHEVDLWYAPRREVLAAWRPRRRARLALGGTLSSANPGDIILTTRRGVWEFAIVVT